MRDDKHDCVPFQKDWNRLSGNNLSFRAIPIRLEWADRQLRIAKEIDLVAEYLAGAVYNGKGIYNVCRVVEIDGDCYPFVAQATRSLPIGEITVRCRLHDTKHLESIKIEAVESGTLISIYGKVYGSIVELVKAGVATNRF